MNKRQKIRERVQRHPLIKSALRSILQSDHSSDEPSNIANTSRIYEDSSSMNDSIHVDATLLQSINEESNEENNNKDKNQHHNFSDSSEDDSILGEDNPEVEEIRNWAITCNIPLAHIDILLNILRKRLLPQLPKCSKTFLESYKAEYIVKAMKEANDQIGEFVYLGIEKGLVNCVNPNAHKDDIIHLQINVDGASPYKSSTKQLWPILCKILHEPEIYSPFPVAIYCGDTKPGDVNEFINDFMEEINSLHKNGLYMYNKKYVIILKHIICDIPARKFLKEIKGHGGYAACERCEVYGKNVGFPNKRVIYPDIDCCRRIIQKAATKRTSHWVFTITTDTTTN